MGVYRPFSGKNSTPQFETLSFGSESQTRPFIRRLQGQPRNRIGAGRVRFGNGSLSMDIWARKGCAIVVGMLYAFPRIGHSPVDDGILGIPGAHSFHAYLSLARNPSGANCWQDPSYGDCKANCAIWSGQEAFESAGCGQGGNGSTRWNPIGIPQAARMEENLTGSWGMRRPSPNTGGLGAGSGNRTRAFSLGS